MNTTEIPSTPKAPTPRPSFQPRSPGVEVCLLRAHSDGGLTFLVRMAAGARAERHDHPGGEETYVLSGALRIDRRVDAQQQPQPDVTLAAGQYAFVPAGEIHEGFAAEETTFLVVAAGGIVRTHEPR